MDMPTKHMTKIKNTKKQFTSNDQNYMGIGGTEVGQPRIIYNMIMLN